MRLNDTDGSTTIEALTALALIAVAGAILVAFSTLGIHSSIKTMASIRDTAHLLSTDELIRQYASRVRIPYWYQTSIPASSSSSMQIPWFEGKRDSILEIDITEGNIHFSISRGEADSEKHIVPGGKYSDITVKPWKVKESQIIGLDVSYSLAGREFRTLAPFSSIPLTGATE